MTHDAQADLNGPELTEAIIHLQRAIEAVQMGAVEQAHIDIGRARAALEASDCPLCKLGVHGV